VSHPNFLTTCEKQKRNPSKSNLATYGQTEGQLGGMKPGSIEDAIEEKE
jgi:hypothetical protein